MRQTVADAAVWMVILGVVANFAAVIAYSRYSMEAKAAIQEADRRDAIAAAEHDQAVLLDRLVTAQMKERLTAQAAELANEQAARLVNAFRAREGTRHQEPVMLPAPVMQKETAPQPNRFHGPGFDTPARIRPVSEQPAIAKLEADTPSRRPRFSGRKPTR
jgi:hypothetical protein